MAVVPRIVIDQCGSVGHARNLVSVIPPAHDSRIAVGVLRQPVVSFSEVVKDLSTPANTKKDLRSPTGEGYEILKTVKNTSIEKSSENNEEPHRPHIDTIIRRHQRFQPRFSSDRMIESVSDLWGSSLFSVFF